MQSLALRVPKSTASRPYHPSQSMPRAPWNLPPNEPLNVKPPRSWAFTAPPPLLPTPGAPPYLHLCLWSPWKVPLQGGSAQERQEAVLRWWGAEGQRLWLVRLVVLLVCAAAALSLTTSTLNLIKSTVSSISVNWSIDNSALQIKKNIGERRNVSSQHPGST